MNKEKEILMNYTIYDYLGLFFLYAFLGWLLETTVAAVRKKHMVNRGFLNGPLCAIYGITAVFMTRYLYELQSSPVFLFLGCMIIATAAEWIADYVVLEAKNLLKYSTMSIQEIAYCLNFPNQSFFGKYFRSHTGMTPSAYRMSK